MWRRMARLYALLSLAISLLVLVNDGVENPLTPVFDTPMRTSDLAEPFRQQRSAEEVLKRSWRRCACSLSGADDFPIAAGPGHG